MPINRFSPDGVAISLSLALFGEAPGATTFNAYKTKIAADGASAFAATLAGTMSAVSNADFAATVLKNLGITGNAALESALTALLTASGMAARGQITLNLTRLLSGLEADATYGAAAKAWNTLGDLAMAYSSNDANNASATVATLTAPAPVAPAAPLSLTTIADNVVGTAGNDVILANIVNNANTLQSADVVNGGAGTDRLFADVGSSQGFSITPVTTNVEEFAVRAQTIATDGNNNNMPGTGIASRTPASQIDAERMVGVNWFESNNSRADVIIEDVRILPTQITKDITVAMVETDPGNVDFGVYFDQYSLRNVTTSTSTLTIQLLDTRSAAAGTAPLKDNPYSSFSFKLAGETQAIESAAIDSAQTYAELLAAVQAAIAANPALNGKVTASLGSTFTVSDTLGQLVSGTEIVLTSSAGALSTDSTTGFRTANGVVPSSSGLHTNVRSGASSSSDLVTVKVVLDDVGRGSTGGDLVIGGLSVGDTSTSPGVQRFEIEVRDNSHLQTINSTNNTLREVSIKNGVTTSSTTAFISVVKDSGNLTVSGITANITEVDGDNTALPGTTAQHNAFGFSDVRLIDGSAMTGRLNFSAEVTQASIAKYLNRFDPSSSNPNPATDNVAFQYLGGTGNDTMRVNIDGPTIASTNSLTGREDFTFVANGGAGNDSITIDLIGASSAWYVDHKMLRNVSVIGGDGNDTVRKLGAGDVRIDLGAGNDTVYADNTGVIGANWLVAATNTNILDLQSQLNPGGTSFIYKGTLTVTFSGSQLDLGGAITAADAAALTNGFESTVSLPTGANNSVNQLHVNQAIKQAINMHPVLSKVLVAADGPGRTLVITSLIDGAFDPDDIIITVAGTDLAALPTQEQTSVLASYRAFAGDASATLTAAQVAQNSGVTARNGVSGMDVNQVAVVTGNRVTQTAPGVAVESDNTILPGAGDDVIVLGTGPTSNDTVRFEGYNLGRKTIINFQNAAAGVGDGDYLSFGSYLTGLTSASGSTVDQAGIPVTINADNTVEANSITILRPVYTARDTFDGLTAERLLAAVNSTNVGTVNYAGINAASLDALNNYVGSGEGTTLVGGIGKAVVLVENTDNAGEYKAFELTFSGTASNTTRDFSGAQLIGTIDIGASANFGLSLTGSAPAAAGTAAPLPPVGPVAATASITAAASVTESAATNTTYTLPAVNGTYTYSIAGFAAGDKIVGVAGVAPSVINNSFTDGTVTLQYAANGNTVSIVLTGLTNAADGSLFGASDFNTVFGAGTLA